MRLSGTASLRVCFEQPALRLPAPPSLKLPSMRGAARIARDTPCFVAQNRAGRGEASGGPFVSAPLAAIRDLPSCITWLKQPRSLERQLQPSDTAPPRCGNPARRRHGGAQGHSTRPSLETPAQDFRQPEHPQRERRRGHWRQPAPPS